MVGCITGRVRRVSGTPARPSAALGVPSDVTCSCLVRFHRGLFSSTVLLQRLSLVTDGCAPQTRSPPTRLPRSSLILFKRRRYVGQWTRPIRSAPRGGALVAHRVVLRAPSVASVGVALQRLPKDGVQGARPIVAAPRGGALTRLRALESTRVRTRRFVSRDCEHVGLGRCATDRMTLRGAVRILLGLAPPSTLTLANAARTMRWTSSRRTFQAMGPPIRSRRFAAARQPTRRLRCA